jgi:hypothetical protein
MSLLSQAPNASLIMPLLLKHLGAAVMGSKSGCYDPEEVFDVSKAFRKVRGGPRGIDGGHSNVDDLLRRIIIPHRTF